VKPFFTPADIEKGANWAQEIKTQLKQSGFCIIALTPESLNSNWIMFEAGAISSSVEKPRICAILFDIEATDLQGPLTAYQATKFSKDDIHKLVKTINSSAGEAAIENGRVDRIFEKWWPDLEQTVSKIKNEVGSSPKPPERTVHNLVEEVLGLSRVMADQQSRGMDRLLKLLEASMQNQAMVNALFNTSIPSALAASTSGPPGTGHKIINLLQQPNALSTTSDLLTSTTAKSE
jgi:hypothetical protein